MGAGPAGLALAVMLAKQGYNVKVRLLRSRSQHDAMAVTELELMSALGLRSARWKGRRPHTHFCNKHCGIRPILKRRSSPLCKVETSHTPLHGNDTVPADQSVLHLPTARRCTTRSCLQVLEKRAAADLEGPFVDQRTIIYGITPRGLQALQQARHAGLWHCTCPQQCTLCRMRQRVQSGMMDYLLTPKRPVASLNSLH